MLSLQCSGSVSAVAAACDGEKIVPSTANGIMLNACHSITLQQFEFSAEKRTTSSCGRRNASESCHTTNTISSYYSYDRRKCEAMINQYFLQPVSECAPLLTAVPCPPKAENANEKPSLNRMLQFSIVCYGFRQCTRLIRQYKDPRHKSWLKRHCHNSWTHYSLAEQCRFVLCLRSFNVFFFSSYNIFRLLLLLARLYSFHFSNSCWKIVCAIWQQHRIRPRP